MTPLTEDGRPPTDEERETIRRVFASDEHGRGICFVCEHARRPKHLALCGVCWNQQTPFWRLAFDGFALLTRAELVIGLRDSRASQAGAGVLNA